MSRIRLEVLNLPLSDWIKIDQHASNGEIEMTVEQFKGLIGMKGGIFLSAKFNNEERNFAKEYFAAEKSATKTTIKK